MSAGQLQQTIAQYRQQLLQHDLAATAALESAYAHVLATIEPRLSRLYQQIADAQASGEPVPLSWLYEQNRLQTLMRFVEGQINHYAALAQMTTGQLQHYGVQLGTRSAQQQLQATVPPGVSWSFGLPSPSALANLVGATQAGSPLSDLFAGFGKEAAENVKTALISGLANGDNPATIAPQVAQALGISRNRALVLSRTETIRAYRSANLETLRANDDVCEGWVWQASLSRRSCAVCIAMNGTKHDLSEEMESHPCCRCVPVPLTKSWDAILGPLGIDTSGIPETSISIPSGASWFAEQDESTQRAILGSNAAYQLYASGKASLSDFVGKSHDAQWGGSLYQKSVKQLTKGK